jgi:hypothetical protein
MCFWGLIVLANRSMNQGQQQREEGKEQVCLFAGSFEAAATTLVSRESELPSMQKWFRGHVSNENSSQPVIFVW